MKMVISSMPSMILATRINPKKLPLIKNLISSTDMAFGLIDLSFAEALVAGALELLIEPRCDLLLLYRIPSAIALRTGLHVIWVISSAAPTVRTNDLSIHEHRNVLPIVNVF